LNLARAASHDAQVAAHLLALRGRSDRQIASTLNERGVASPRGGAWHGVQVKRVRSRLGFKA
jgi:hypothetical protein